MAGPSRLGAYQCHRVGPDDRSSRSIVDTWTLAGAARRVGHSPTTTLCCGARGVGTPRGRCGNRRDRCFRSLGSPPPPPCRHRFTTLGRPQRFRNDPDMRSQIGTAALTRAPVTPSAGWDLLLLCVAVHMMIAVGRIHQLFPVLLPLKPAIVTGVAAIIFYLMQQRGLRRLTALGGPTTTCVLLLLVWATLSIPGALYPRAAFELVTDRFIKTVVLYLLIVGAVRTVADVERLAFVYFLAAATYAAVILLTFDVGQGSWRLSHIYYYDANDFATFAVTALPLGLHFVLGQRKWLGRLVGAAGLMVLTMAFVWSGSRGGFLAIVAVAVCVLLRYSTIPGRWRLLGVGVITVVFLTTASEQYWTQMNTIFDSQGDYNRTEDEGR